MRGLYDEGIILEGCFKAILGFKNAPVILTLIIPNSPPIHKKMYIQQTFCTVCRKYAGTSARYFSDEANHKIN